MERVGPQSRILLVPKSLDPNDTYRRLTRRIPIHPASRFVPSDPNATPEEHFPLQSIAGRAPFPRFVNCYSSREILLVVDGSCLNNGRYLHSDSPAQGGCSFLYKHNHTANHHPLTLLGDGADPGGQQQQQQLSGKIGFRMEAQGPTGTPAEHTSNRAKLRAVIASLQFRHWPGEGWRRIVVLTDLEYIVHSATRDLPRWVARRWRRKPTPPPAGRHLAAGMRAGRRYANRNLWEELQGVVDGLRAQGCEVSFWLVGTGDLGLRQSRYVAETKEAAREAVRRAGVTQEEEFTKMCGIFV